MSPVILPYQEIEHQEFNLTEHGIKLKDIKEIFKIADTANTFVCDQELWNKIISYDYSSIAKPEKPKKEPKVKKETKPKVKKEIKIEEEKPKQEEIKQEEIIKVKVEEEEKPKETKKKTTKKTTRVKRDTKPKAKKEVEPKVEMKEMSEADILNSISVDTSVLELDDVRQDFNLE